MSKMMVRANRAKGKRQGGFALLEVLLAVIVIALATWGVVELFASAKSKNSTTKMTDDLGKIQAAYANIANSGIDPVTVQALFDTGTITADMVDNTTAASKFIWPIGNGKWNNISINAYGIQIDQLSEQEAKDIAYSQLGAADVDVVVGPSLPVPAKSMTKTDISGVSSSTGGMFGVTLCYPKGSMCADKPS